MGPTARPAPTWANCARTGAISRAALDSPPRAAAHSLEVPLSIEEAAELIGCSPWTVRQTLIPRGLPHFRFKANGRLVFYRDQVMRWIENQQRRRIKNT